MTPPTVTLTRDQAQTLQQILRHISTSNAAVIEAAFVLYHDIDTQLHSPSPSVCPCQHCND